MKQLYLIRLDDACPTMDREKWRIMEDILDKYGIKPMVGIIPDCHDVEMKRDSFDIYFWQKAITWQEKGWAIALHGYDHCYVTKIEGINPMWRRSEFAGLPLQEQRKKIRKGVNILKGKGLYPHFFFAPSHTFDENTLIALKEESDIRIISDTIGRYPYKYKDIGFIPQITGHCMKMPFNGIYTFCFHPNTMSNVAFQSLQRFLADNKDRFVSFNDIDMTLYRKKKVFDRLLSWSFFTYRKLRGLR